MSEKKNTISAYVQKFVARKFEQFREEANKGCGLHYELYAQRFSDSVDGLWKSVKREDLREYIMSEAREDGDYSPAEDGRWVYDHETDECNFHGPHGVNVFPEDVQSAAKSGTEPSRPNQEHAITQQPKGSMFEQIVSRMGRRSAPEKPREPPKRSRSIDR